MSIFRDLKNIDKSKLAAGVAGLAAASTAAENAKLQEENRRLQEEMDKLRKIEHNNMAIKEKLEREKIHHYRPSFNDGEAVFVSDMHVKGLVLYELEQSSDAANPSLPRKWMPVLLCENNHIHIWNPASFKKLNGCPHCGERIVDLISIPYHQPKKDKMVYRRQIVLIEKQANPLLNQYKMVKSAPTHYLFNSECKACGKRANISWENGLCRQCDPDNINASPVDEAFKPWFRINYYLCPNGHVNVYSTSKYYWWPRSFSEYTDDGLTPCRFCHAKLSSNDCYTIYPEETSYEFQFIRIKAPTVASRAEYRVQVAEKLTRSLIFKESHKKLPDGDFHIEYELPDETAESKEIMELIKKKDMKSLHVALMVEQIHPSGNKYYQYTIAIHDKKLFKNIFVLESPDETDYEVDIAESPISLCKTNESIDNSTVVVEAMGQAAATTTSEMIELRKEDRRLQKEAERMRESVAVGEKLLRKILPPELSGCLEIDDEVMSNIIQFNEMAVDYFSSLLFSDPTRAIIEYLNLSALWERFSRVANSESGKCSAAYHNYTKMRHEIDTKLENIPDYIIARDLCSNLHSLEDASIHISALLGNKPKPERDGVPPLPPGIKKDISSAVSLFIVPIAMFIVATVFDVVGMGLIIFIIFAVACLFGVFVLFRVNNYRANTSSTWTEYNNNTWKWNEDIRENQKLAEVLLVKVDANMAKIPKALIEGLSVPPKLQKCKSMLRANRAAGKVIQAQ